jgi:hypothetical protein
MSHYVTCGWQYEVLLPHRVLQKHKFLAKTKRKSVRVLACRSNLVLHFTDEFGAGGNFSDLYTGGSRFGSQLGHCLSVLRGFVVFLSLCHVFHIRSQFIVR